ncbi:nuclear receptor-binding factor 2-like [Sitophilus oryzae]|uniref:Nuclear receptor-binding factor 2-like n=1 Tax=Sitophilus oryzae TaxID=7048 RepID=A0A6J2XX70_SITOR|nr:nuclear receptor-binding factor 2-like [Sitophilus oryzae]
MDTDKAPLNRAHQLERKAETLNRQKKYDAAIECHKEAAELFKKCLGNGSNKTINESIGLQKEWNERQIRLLELKKAYMEKMEKEKKFGSVNSSKTSQKDLDTLETKIFRAMETHDSLISYLTHRDNVTDKIQGTIQEEDEDPQFIIGNKHPKDESTVIEELKLLSGQLRESVHGLLIQLDDRNKEIESLKSRIYQLEFEKSTKEEITTNNLRVTTDSSGGTSPFVFSPMTELSPDIPELSSLPILDLKPMPEFDISQLRQFSVPEVSSKLLRRD